MRDRALRIMERRARLLGLDRKTADGEVPDTVKVVVEYVDAELPE